MGTTIRILTVIVLAAMLAGCDKCGNWFFTAAAPFGLEACRGTVPPKQ